MTSILTQQINRVSKKKKEEEVTDKVQEKEEKLKRIKELPKNAEIQ